MCMGFYGQHFRRLSSVMSFSIGSTCVVNGVWSLFSSLLMRSVLLPISADRIETSSSYFHLSLSLCLSLCLSLSRSVFFLSLSRCVSVFLKEFGHKSLYHFACDEENFKRLLYFLGRNWTNGSTGSSRTIRTCGMSSIYLQSNPVKLANLDIYSSKSASI